MAEQGALMEILRDGVTESAANTYTEVEIQTPVSRTEKLAMLIWQILFSFDRPDIEDGQGNQTTVGLFDETQTTVPNLDAAAVLHRTYWRVEAGGVQGSLSEYFRDQIFPGALREFQPPVLYAKSSMFLGIIGSGNANVKAVSVHVGYTLERVPPDIFIAALVE